MVPQIVDNSAHRLRLYRPISPAKSTGILTEPSVACNQCADLCVRYAIRHPRELRKAIQIAGENIADKTIAEVIPESPCVSVSFVELAKGAVWDDVVEYHFRCLHCDEKFWLHAETYHGSGGYWEPKDPKSIRENITN
ncbi:hypothetical protein [Paraburkholderia sp. J10-1]|uniref:hypothetical protein n=1 Tax=Paraburkholderia sp. J10-1 TaxID=2805430 RepID=UPI002AB5E1DF|nr:hypothetical protein [Paraburkholderia sp. J10-1]